MWRAMDNDQSVAARECGTFDYSVGVRVALATEVARRARE